MNTLQTTAINLLEHNIAVVPAAFKSKLPSIQWRVWQDKLPPKKMVLHWFSNPSNNLAIVCGGKNNLAVIDFDREDSYFEWRKAMISRSDHWSDVAKRTYRVRTSRGIHLYVYTRDVTFNSHIVEKKIDIRGKGGIVIAPPSTHPSGVKYYPLGSIDDILTVDSLSDIFPEEPEKITPRQQESQVAEYEVDFLDQAVKLDSEIINTIKQRVSVLNYVSQYTRMSRTSADGRWWYGRCISPSHEDRNPSFRVDNHRNYATCLTPGCEFHNEKGMSIIDVYMLLNSTTFSEAVRDLMLLYLKD